jgi:hypothetical protein
MKAHILRNTLLMFFTFKFFGCEHIVQSKSNYTGNGASQIIKNYYYEHGKLVVSRFIEGKAICRATTHVARIVVHPRRKEKVASSR